MTQRAETTVAEFSLTCCVRACLRIGSHTMPGQHHSQPTPTSLRQGVYASLGVICHLHFWWNDRSLLRASAVTLGWNGHRIKSQHISTQSELWRIKFSRRSCRDSNSQPFDHESGAFTNKPSRLLMLFNFANIICQYGHVSRSSRVA